MRSWDRGEVNGLVGGNLFEGKEGCMDMWREVCVGKWKGLTWKWIDVGKVEGTVAQETWKRVTDLIGFTIHKTLLMFCYVSNRVQPHVHLH